MSTVVKLNSTQPRDRALAEFKRLWLEICFDADITPEQKSLKHDMLLVQHTLCRHFGITHSELIDCMADAVGEKLAREVLGRFVAALTFTLLGVKE